MKKIITIVALTILFTISISFAGSCLGENRCSSQLLRLEVNNQILENGGVENLLPALGSLARSTFLQNTIVKKYEIPAIAFPHNRETCQNEKERGNRRFRNVDCSASNLCERGVVDRRVREAICFAIPCTLLEGDRDEGKCRKVQSIYSEKIGFPDPLELTKIELNPTSLDYKDGQANLCFDVDKIEGSVSADVSLDTTDTDIFANRISVNSIKIKMNEPRSVCVSAKIDLTSSNPISNIVITPQGSEPFISNEMIIAAAQGSSVIGLRGYTPEALEQVKNQLLPVLFHPLRPQVETGVRQALQKVFEQQLASLASSLGPANGDQALYMNSSETLGQLSVANVMVGNQLSVLECSTIQVNGGTIPADHACIGKKSHLGEVITQATQLDPSWERNAFAVAIRESNASSSSIIDRLEAVKPLILNEPYVQSSLEVGVGTPGIWSEMHQQSLDSTIRNIDQLIARMKQNQLRESAVRMIGITNSVSSGNSREISLLAPEVCDGTNPSNHAGRSIPNCPAQTYVDLEEFNSVLDAMWNSGALCMQGRGADRESTRYIGPFETKGCYMKIAEGFSCKIKAAPEMSYNSRTRKYDTAIQLEECYKAPVGGVLGELLKWKFPSLESLGSFGADFNINLSSELDINSEGSIEARNSNSTFSIVPGSESGGLLETDRFNREVTKGINEAFADVLSAVITIPVRDITSSMLGFPVSATGKIDQGPGYFGICFTPESSNP